MSHTPGPWRLERDTVNSYRIYADRPADTVAQIIVETEEDVTMEIESNARLIAAAPDLLAALKAAYDRMELTGIHGGNPGCNSDHMLYGVPPTHVVHHFDCATQLRIGAAIAKAEGKEGGA